MWLLENVKGHMWLDDLSTGQRCWESKVTWHKASLPGSNVGLATNKWYALGQDTLFASLGFVFLPYKMGMLRWILPHLPLEIRRSVKGENLGEAASPLSDAAVATTPASAPNTITVVTVTTASSFSPENQATRAGA